MLIYGQNILIYEKNGIILTNKMPYFCVSTKHNASYIMAIAGKNEANCFTYRIKDTEKI